MEIFRAYDIRGIYPEQINGDIAYLVGRAFVKFLKKEKANIVVGRDARLSTPELFKGLVRGITDEGGNVIDIGLAITPMVYFTTAHFNFDGGIKITASHNPANYNGFKMVRENAVPISGQSGIKKIQEIVVKDQSLNQLDREKKGTVQAKEVLSEYVKFNLKDFDLSDEEKKEIKEFQFLTQKPIVYVFNINKDQTENIPLQTSQGLSINLNLKLEEEMTELSKTEIKELNLKSQLDLLILFCYNILDLVTFFTIAGGKELRAWTIKKGSNAVSAGGVVHSDFEKKFIKAEIIPWQKLIAAKSWNEAKESGLLKIVGKDHIIQDGNIIEFKI
ncbi:DUF933 domain-containing protein [Patescibacteria group bacterium]